MTTADLIARAMATANRLRAAGQTDRANRFSGRAEVVIARNAARNGELLPTLYVQTRYVGGHLRRMLVTWPGNVVAVLEETGRARAFNCELTCYACTIEGRRYYGRGHGPGMYLNMRPGRLMRGERG